MHTAWTTAHLQIIQNMISMFVCVNVHMCALVNDAKNGFHDCICTYIHIYIYTHMHRRAYRPLLPGGGDSRFPAYSYTKGEMAHTQGVSITDGKPYPFWRMNQVRIGSSKVRYVCSIRRDMICILNQARYDMYVQSGEI